MRQWYERVREMALKHKTETVIVLVLGYIIGRLL
jgi:hypothetical protein